MCGTYTKLKWDVRNIYQIEVGCAEHTPN